MTANELINKSRKMGVLSRELRIGSLILYQGEPKEIAGITEEYPYINDITFDYLEWDEVKPIPLTEEWLLKLGFEYDKTMPFLLCKGAFNINTENHNIWQYGHKVITSPRHVHQLQNLYFALSGQELEVKAK